MKRPRLRRFFRFKLATLLIVSTLIAVALGFILRSHGQRQAIAAIRQAGGDVRYHYQIHRAGGLSESPVPSWLRGWLGDEYFLSPASVSVRNGTANDDVLAQLPKLPYLEQVLIEGPFTRSGLKNLSQLPRLKKLYIFGAQIRDGDLSELEELRQLNTLLLSCPKVTDAGLAHLKSLDQLDKLLLVCSMTDAGLVHLRGLDRLETLFLEGPITDAGLKQLHGLKRLESFGCQTQKRVYIALQDPALLEYIDVPLADCMQDLAVKHKIAIRIDRPALNRAGVRSDIPVSIDRRVPSLKEALDEILSPRKLGWTSDAQGIVVTTAEKADEAKRGARELRHALPNIKIFRVDW